MDLRADLDLVAVHCPVPAAPPAIEDARAASPLPLGAQGAVVADNQWDAVFEFVERKTKGWTDIVFMAQKLRIDLGEVVKIVAGWEELGVMRLNENLTKVKLLQGMRDCPAPNQKPALGGAKPGAH